MALVCMFGGKRIHALFPGVLAAAALGILFSRLTDYAGTTVGEIPVGAPPISFDFPLGEIPSLMLPAIVIALVGFAEAGSIARTFAGLERRPWNSNREFVAQGMANLTAGASGGYPVCGSFSRSAVNRLSGAQTRWAGAITGVVVLAFLPAAAVLESLPKAVLAAIIIGAVATLVRPLPILRLWRYSRPQFLVAAVTFVCTLVFSEHVDYALLIGISLAIVVHLWREMRIDLDVRAEGETLHLTPRGVLWYGGAKSLEEALGNELSTHSGLRRLELHLEGLGRIDVTGALALRTVAEEAKRSGLSVTMDGVPDHARRLVTEIALREEHPFGGGH
jgi:SulP family sulfate permease